jgi:hypothetical protein
MLWMQAVVGCRAKKGHAKSMEWPGTFSTPTSAERLFKFELGGVDILVNNAAHQATSKKSKTLKTKSGS